MKGICFLGDQQVAVRDVEDPQILDPRDAIVRVSMAGLCGSDLHPFYGREVGLDVGTVMGHELVGEVLVVGDAVTRFQVGDRVYAPFSTNCGQCFYCNIGLTSRCDEGQLFGWVERGQGLPGCQSELVRVPLADGSLMNIPDGLSYESALLLGDNFSTGYYGAEMAGVEPGKVCAVIGCGTVGQLAIVSALAMGADRIVAIDPVARRREDAERLGARPVAPESARAVVDEWTAGRGADAVMELVGLPQAQQLAYELIRPGGVMSVIGCHCSPSFEFGPADAYNKNLTYRTGRCPARSYMDKLTDEVVAGRFDLSSFITHRFPVDHGQEAYDVFANKKDGCIKAVIEFQ